MCVAGSPVTERVPEVGHGRGAAAVAPEFDPRQVQLPGQHERRHGCWRTALRRPRPPGRRGRGNAGGTSGGAQRGRYACVNFVLLGVSFGTMGFYAQ